MPLLSYVCPVCWAGLTCRGNVNKHVAKLHPGAELPAYSIQRLATDRELMRRRKRTEENFTDDPRCPLIHDNSLKEERAHDEVQWNFTQPQEIFINTLKMQLNYACFRQDLISKLFNSPEEAIVMLVEDLPHNSKAVVCNLDLILKWITLLTFDSNEVLMKGLDYLQTVFTLLFDENYSMSRIEAESFIPYLVLKVGDPEDAVRRGIRSLFKQIGQVCDVSRLFSHVLGGLKSKSARQRTECLEELGDLIKNHGITVCTPSAAVALEEVAKQISDMDNEVCNAALNCIVQAFFLEGDEVFKMIGKISVKERSLLEKRIEHSGGFQGPSKDSTDEELAELVNKLDIKEDTEEVKDLEPTVVYDLIEL